MSEPTLPKPLPIHPTSGLRALWVSPSGRAFYPIAGASQAAVETEPHALLARLQAQRAEREAFITALLDQVESEGRSLVDAERNLLNAARERIEEIDRDIEPLEAVERAIAAHRAAIPTPPAPGGQQRAAGQPGQPLGYTEPRPHEYRTAGDFMVDLVHGRGLFGESVDADAMQRVVSAVPYLARALNNQTTDDVPGLLPHLIVGQVQNDLDGSRPFITSLGPVNDLGSVAGKVFSRPSVTQHTHVGEQEEEKTELVSRQYKVDGKDFTKRTFGGALDVSRQTIDWTSPAAWNALITDLQAVYAEDTDDIAAADFAAGVEQAIAAPADASNVGQWVTALYQAAAMAATKGGTIRARAGRLPDHIWLSVDMWAVLGAAIDTLAVTQAAQRAAGQTAPTVFAGNILDVPRTVVPGFDEGTVVVGRASRYEFWEQRIGLLQAVEPRLLGVEIAYGGYAAFGFLDDTAFARIGGEEEAPQG